MLDHKPSTSPACCEDAAKHPLDPSWAFCPYCGERQVAKPPEIVTKEVRGKRDGQ